MEISSRLKAPLPAHTCCTRYVDLHGFLYFITQNKLRFARLDTFEDLNEGFSVHTAEAVRGFSSQAAAIAEVNEKDKVLQEVKALQHSHHALSEKYRQYQQDLYACCWYMGEKESVAMWNLYSNSDSVAIRFNTAALVTIIEDVARKGKQQFGRIEYGVMEYIDLATLPTPIDDHCIGFVKDLSFRHEQEFRFMAHSNNSHTSTEIELCIGNLQNIDFTIISHPKMEEWKIRNIIHVLDCYGLAGKFTPSQLTLKKN